MKNFFIVAILIAIFLVSFYLRTMSFFKYGFGYIGSYDGIVYTYLATSLNHDFPPHPYTETVNDQPPLFFYLSAFLSKFLGDINGTFFVAAFLTSIATIGVFFFVRLLSKSTFYALVAAFLIGVTADLNIFYGEVWLYGIGAALIPLLIFLINKLMQKDDLRFWILSGIIVGIHFLIHSLLTVTVVLPIIFFYQLLTESRKVIKKLALMLISFLLVASAYIPNLYNFYIVNFSSLYPETADLRLTGIYPVVQNIRSYLPEYFAVLVMILFPLTLIKISKNKIKLQFPSDKAFKLFAVWFIFYVINFGLRFLNINTYWSYRFALLFPQFVIISLPVLFSRLPLKLSRFAFLVVAVSILLLSYPMWIEINKLKPVIIDQEKFMALEWLDKSTDKNSTILFINNLPEFDGFGRYKDFSWRANDEISLQGIQLVFQNKSSLARNYTYFVIVKSEKNIAQLPNGTVFQATEILIQNSKKIGYDKIVYNNSKVVILGKL